MKEEYYSINEICETFKIIYFTIYKKMKSGEILTIKK